MPRYSNIFSLTNLSDSSVKISIKSKYLPPVAMLELPADFYYLVCEELANRQDFGTLFNCALSGKILVGSALLWLYR